MKNAWRLRLLSFLLGLAGGLAACDDDKETLNRSNPDLPFQALSADNELLQLNVNNIGGAVSATAITGLQPDERLLSIDYRPATGQLYGLGSTSRLYTLDPSTGAARPVGAGPFTPTIDGTAATIDFNPTADRIRLVSNTGQNLQLNPETGLVEATEAALNGVADAAITEVAYNNNTAGSSSTVLYDLDPTTDRLYQQVPPNDGKLADVGPLGVDFTGAAGFDIAAGGNQAVAALTVASELGLYALNLTTGRATLYATFPVGTTIIGLAIPTLPVAYAADADNNLLTFNPANPQTPIQKAITGMQTSEKIVGLDLRPATGQLYGLANTGRLYTLNMASGAAVVVGTGAALPVTGTEFGFDFNPVPVTDRIRVVSDAGLNLLVNPADGTSVAGATLLPGSTGATAAAYAGISATVDSPALYLLDSGTDRLYQQASATSGAPMEVGPLGVNITGINGFDIGGRSGTTYAVLTVGTATSVYEVNLTTGAATRRAALSKPVQALAVGLGF